MLTVSPYTSQRSGNLSPSLKVMAMSCQNGEVGACLKPQLPPLLTPGTLLEGPTTPVNQLTAGSRVLFFLFPPWLLLPSPFPPTLVLWTLILSSHIPSLAFVTQVSVTLGKTGSLPSL